MKAGTGKRIFEFESLAIYWYNGILLCAALKNKKVYLIVINFIKDLPSFTNSKWDTKNSIGTIFF